MVETPLLRYDLLSTPAFVRDMRSFLSLSADIIFAIAELANTPDGFTGHKQARSLSSRYGLQTGKVMRDLRFAEYLYDRFTSIHMEITDAVNEIGVAASEFEEPVTIDDHQRTAIKEVLSFKREYEISKAMKAGVTSNAPHFMKFKGVWTIRPIKIEDEETILSPVLNMSMVWHDGSGNSHEAFFQMSDDDWREFIDEIDILSKSRRDIEAILE